MKSNLARQTLNLVTLTDGSKYEVCYYIQDKFWTIPGWLIELLTHNKWQQRVAFKASWKPYVDKGYLIKERNSKTALLLVKNFGTNEEDVLMFLTQIN